MLNIKYVAVVLGLVTTLSFAHEAQVVPLQEKTISGLDQQRLVGQMLIVAYEAGGFTEKHRHPAHTFVYVLEGRVEMQVEGGERMILEAGDSFYEKPEDIHIVSQNASHDQPAKLLVFSVKEEGQALVIPVE